MKKLFKIFCLIGFLSVSLFAAGNIVSGNVAVYKVTIKKLELYNSTTSKWIQVSGGESSNINIASADAGASVAAMVAEDAAITFGTYTKARATIGNTFSVKACVGTDGVTACTDNSITNSGDGVTSGAITLTGGHTGAVATTSLVATSDGVENTARRTPGLASRLADASEIGITVDFSASNVTLPSGVTLSGSDVMAEQILTSPFVVGENTPSPSISVDFDVNNVLTATKIPDGSGGYLNIDSHGADDYYILVDFPTVTVTIN